MPIPRKGTGLEHSDLPPSRRKRREVSQPGRAVVLTPGGGAESFLAAGAALPRCQGELEMGKGHHSAGF